MRQFKEAVALLLKQEQTMKFENVVIEQVDVKPYEKSARVVLYLDKPVKQYCKNDDGEYVLRDTTVLFTTNIELAAAFANSKGECRALGSVLKDAEHAKRLELLLPGATINVLSEDVDATEEGWTSIVDDTPNEKALDHRIVKHLVTDIRLSEEDARPHLERLYDKIMG